MPIQEGQPVQFRFAPVNPAESYYKGMAQGFQTEYALEAARQRRDYAAKVLEERRRYMDQYRKILTGEDQAPAPTPAVAAPQQPAPTEAAPAALGVAPSAPATAPAAPTTPAAATALGVAPEQPAPAAPAQAEQPPSGRNRPARMIELILSHPLAFADTAQMMAAVSEQEKQSIQQQSYPIMAAMISGNFDAAADLLDESADAVQGSPTEPMLRAMAKQTRSGERGAANVAAMVSAVGQMTGGSNFAQNLAALLSTSRGEAKTPSDTQLEEARRDEVRWLAPVLTNSNYPQDARSMLEGYVKQFTDMANKMSQSGNEAEAAKYRNNAEISRSLAESFRATPDKAFRAVAGVISQKSPSYANELLATLKGAQEANAASMSPNISSQSQTIISDLRTKRQESTNIANTAADLAARGAAMLRDPAQAQTMQTAQTMWGSIYRSAASAWRDFFGIQDASDYSQWVTEVSAATNKLISASKLSTGPMSDADMFLLKKGVPPPTSSPQALINYFTALAKLHSSIAFFNKTNEEFLYKEPNDLVATRSDTVAGDIPIGPGDDEFHSIDDVARSNIYKYKVLQERERLGLATEGDRDWMRSIEAAREGRAPTPPTQPAPIQPQQAPEQAVQPAAQPMPGGNWRQQLMGADQEDAASYIYNNFGLIHDPKLEEKMRSIPVSVNTDQQSIDDAYIYAKRRLRNSVTAVFDAINSDSVDARIRDVIRLLKRLEYSRAATNISEGLPPGYKNDYVIDLTELITGSLNNKKILVDGKQDILDAMDGILTTEKANQL